MRPRILAVTACASAMLLTGCGNDASDAAPSPTATVATGAQAWNVGDPTGTAINTATSSEITGSGYTPPATAPTTTAAPRTTGAIKPQGPVLPAFLDAAKVNRNDAAAVAQAVLKTWFAWNTVVDQNPAAAAARASSLLSTELRQRVSSAGSSAAGEPFVRFKAKSAVVTPVITAEPPTASPPTMRYRIVLKAIGPSNTEVDSATGKVAVTVRKTTTGWEVSSIDPI